MDEIQKTLEKQQKNQPEDPLGKKDRMNISTGNDGPQAKRPKRRRSSPLRINYSQSSVVEVQEETLRNNRLIAYFDGDLISDQYKIIKTKILQKTREQGLNTILVTSAFRSEGKSVTASNIAISLAKELTHTVLLVDADLRKPSLHQLFSIEPKMGLSDYLLNDAPLADLFINPGINRLLFLPGHLSIDNSAESISAPKMERLVQELKARYPERYVIFDSSPLIESAEALILADYVDGVILVVEAGKTQLPYIEKALELLKDRNLIGLVLNKGEIPESKKYYYYSGLNP
jgi:exopolysaccharide/PEP-CTERM locus tyrosine autokinase